jgi:hypothetical protein
VKSRNIFHTQTAHALKLCAEIIFAPFQNVGASMAETMQQMMAREQAEAIASLKKANRALERIFGIQEEEDEE